MKLSAQAVHLWRCVLIACSSAKTFCKFLSIFEAVETLYFGCQVAFTLAFHTWIHLLSHARLVLSPRFAFGVAVNSR